MSKTVPVMGDLGHFEKIRGAVHGVHVLVDDAPHVAAFAADDVFDAQALCFGVHFGVEALHGFMGGEHAEVPALGGVGAPGVIQPDGVEKHQVAHEGVGAGIGEDVSRGGNEEDLGALAVEGGFYPHVGDRFDLVHEEIDHVLEGVGLDAEVVSVIVAVGRRADDPVDVAADEVEQFPADHGDFGGIDAVRTKERAATAFGTLEEVHEPLFDDVLGQFPGAGDPAHELAGHGEVVTVDRPEEFRPQDRHVLRIAGTEIEMTLIGACAATDADVHEDLERAEFFQPLAEPVEKDFLPVVGELPVLIGGRPFPGVRQSQYVEVLGLTGIAPVAGLEDHGGVHPPGFRDLVVYDEFVCFGYLCHIDQFSFSTGSPASIIFSRK